MEEAWDWVEQELKKIQDDMPQDPETMQVVDAISVADFWKRRYDEELMLWERKLVIKEEEKRSLQEKAQTHEMSIKQLDYKLRELERRWEHEKLLFEDRLKAKESETDFERTQRTWDTRLRTLEEENKALKNQLGMVTGIAMSPQPGVIGSPAIELAKREAEKHIREREETLKYQEEEARQRLEKLESEKKDIASVMADKEKALQAEREKWSNLEKELKGMSAQMAQQLSGLKEREEEHFVILEDLARGFAHRVRNYLGIISGTVQLSLANYTMDKELEEQLKVVDQNVQEMLKSIEEFLGLARIPQMELQPVDVHQEIDAALQAYADKIASQNITCRKDFAGGVPALKADRKLVNDALRHLIENAVEAMPQGGQLIVGTRFDPAKQMISLSIKDTGVGMADNHIKKVFQPYFTSKKNRKGLGLTIAKRIVDLHRGTLSFVSVKGQGTTVSVNLFNQGT